MSTSYYAVCSKCKSYDYVAQRLHPERFSACSERFSAFIKKHNDCVNRGYISILNQHAYLIDCGEYYYEDCMQMQPWKDIN